MKKTFQIFILSLVLLSPIIPFFIDSPTALAQTPTVNSTDVLNKGYTPLAPLTETMIGGKVTLASYLSGLYKISIAIGSVFAVLMIVWGGIQRMTSEGLEGKSAGMDKVNNAIFGLILLVSAYTILYVINPNLVNFKLGLNTEVDPEVARKLGQAYTNNQSADIAYTKEILKTIEDGKQAYNDAIKTGNWVTAENALMSAANTARKFQINGYLASSDPKRFEYANNSLNALNNLYYDASEELTQRRTSQLVNDGDLSEADSAIIRGEANALEIDRISNIIPLKSTINEAEINNILTNAGKIVYKNVALQEITKAETILDNMKKDRDLAVTTLSHNNAPSNTVSQIESALNTKISSLQVKIDTAKTTANNIK